VQSGFANALCTEGSILRYTGDRLVFRSVTPLTVYDTVLACRKYHVLPDQAEALIEEVRKILRR